MKNPEQDGMKFDNEKNDYTLMPWAELLEVQEVLMFGAKKYAPDNWKKVSKLRYFSAALRHIIEEWWLKKVRKDHESGSHPLAHAICDLLFIMYLDKQDEIQVSSMAKPEGPKNDFLAVSEFEKGLKIIGKAFHGNGMGGDGDC